VKLKIEDTIKLHHWQRKCGKNMNIKSKDIVVIKTGKDKGTRGPIEKVFPTKNRIIVGGVNIVKRHAKKTSTRGGGIVEKPAAIDASNVMLICPHCDLATRVSYQIQDGEKKRMCKKCKKVIS